MLASQRTILLNALVIMLCIVVPTMLATVAFVWWFRPGNTKAARRPHWSFSSRIEIVTWSVPMMTIVFLGGMAWIGSHDLDPGKPLASERKPLDVQVVSLDWKWLFIYPEQKVASLNRLVLPVGTPVHFRLTSASVWNAFFVPRLGSMIYLMSGMATQLHLRADREGSFLGLSAMLSGDGFADMHFKTTAVSQAAFAQWVRDAQGSTQVLDDAAIYLIGLGLAALLTALSFVISDTDLIYAPGVPVALIVFAIAQVGVHLVFFLHLTTLPDNVNNAMALAFGVLVVVVLIGGTVWIITHMNQNMMPTGGPHPGHMQSGHR